MVDTIKFSQMTSGGDIANNDKVPGLQSGENVLFNNPWTFLPPGTTAERPLPSSTINYRLRFNTDDQLYEYYDAILGMWTQLQESAFTVGPFITYTDDASLPDAQNLGALANGILKQTITLGVATLDIAVNGTDYYGPGFVIPGTDGGTGINNGTKTINLGSPTTGYVLTSDSLGNATWQSVTAGGVITTIDGDSGSATPTAGVVTINGGSTGLTTTGAGSTLSLGGLLNTTFGGIGVSNPTAHGVLIGEGASPVTPIVLGAGQILIGTTASDPVAAAINSGTNILVQNSSGSITIGITGIIGVTNGGTGLAALTAHNLLIGNGSSSVTLLPPSATSGIPLISQGAAADPAYGTAVVSGGGTGNTTFTAYSVICGGITATGAFQNVSGVGTANQVLVSNGAGLLPSWQSVPGLTPAALTKTDDTNVTLTLGGSPTVALLAATSLTLGWTGQLSLTRGGTNASLTASNGGIFYSTASAGAILAGTATAQQLLMSGASTTPQWSTSTYPLTNAVNTLLYASSANVMAALATANNGVLVTSAGGVPSISTTLPSGLTIPGYAASGANSDITSMSGLTGKLRAPTAIASSANLDLLQFTYTASAVNMWNIANSATGSPLQITATGSDPTVTYGMYAKGGLFHIADSLATTGSRLRYYAGNALNYTSLGTATAQATNLDLTLPGADGSSGSFIQTNASGVLSFSTAPTGTGAPVRTSSPDLTTPNIIGTSTNNNAAAGSVGELISSVIAFSSAVSLSNNTAANVTSISLTAGDWDVEGNVNFSFTGLSTYAIGWSSNTSATLPDASLYNASTQVSAAAQTPGFSIPFRRVSLASTTTIYLSAQAGFSTGTAVVCGGIYARRRR